MNLENHEYKFQQALESSLLISQPWAVPTLTTVYLGFVLWAGPHFMAGRPAFQLSRFLIFYNICQIIINGNMVMQFVTNTEAISYLSNNFCHPPPPGESPFKMEFVKACNTFLISRIIDLVDTVVLVLRKKNSQITFLHVYHHTIMVLFVWISIIHFPAEHGVFWATMNAFVHVIMYSYYLLSGLGPQYQKYLWWKKYLTTLQLVHFAVAMGGILYLLLNNCTVSKLYNYVWLVNVVIICSLFIKFYIETYMRKNHRQEGKQN